MSYSTSGTTGQKCIVGGIYYCQTHPSNEIPIAAGDTFPPCSWGSGHGTTWVLKVRAK